jgi:hypothetical protein
MTGIGRKSGADGRRRISPVRRRPAASAVATGRRFKQFRVKQFKQFRVIRIMLDRVTIRLLLTEGGGAGGRGGVTAATAATAAAVCCHASTARCHASTGLAVDGGASAGPDATAGSTTAAADTATVGGAFTKELYKFPYYRQYYVWQFFY